VTKSKKIKEVIDKLDSKKKQYRVKISYLLDHSIEASSEQEAVEIVRRSWMGEGWPESAQEIEEEDE
jgi:nucleoid DNA-binding protein